MITIDLNTNEDNKTTFYASVIDDSPIVQVYVSTKRIGHALKLLVVDLFTGSQEQWELDIASRLKDYLIERGIINIDDENQESLNLQAYPNFKG